MFDPDKIPFAVVAELKKVPLCAGISNTDKQKASLAIFNELHEWATINMAMGAGKRLSEKQMKAGLKIVAKRFQTDPALSRKYGFVDPVTILTVIAAIISIIGWVVRWWNGKL